MYFVLSVLLCPLHPLGHPVMCGCSGFMPRKSVQSNARWSRCMQWRSICKLCICMLTRWRGSYHQGFLRHHPHPMMTISFPVYRPKSAGANDANSTHHETKKKKTTPRIEKVMTICKNKQLYEYLRTVSQSRTVDADWSPLCTVVFVLLLIYIFRRIHVYYDSSRESRCRRDPDVDRK